MKTKIMSRVPRAAVLLLGISVATSFAQASPPSRQTPLIVSKDKQGVVETAPCQLPPGAGGRVCTPNARDYGYFEGTWRKWPTQQRYDQTFPQAIGATPIKPNASRPAREVPLAPAESALPPGSAYSTGGGAPSGDFELPELPQTSIIETPTPGLTPITPTTPTITAPSITAPTLTAPTLTAPTLEAPVPETPTLEALMPAAPSLDTTLEPVPSLSPIPAAPEDMPSVPVAPLEDLSAPLDGASGLPALDGGSDEIANPLDSIPELTKNQNGNQNREHSIINAVTQADASTFDKLSTAPYQPGLTPAAAPSRSPFDMVDMEALPVNYEEAEQPTPAKESVPETTPGTVGAMLSTGSTDDISYESSTDTAGIGLDGFCPVTLLQSEEWVEGNASWSVVHHGVTYHLSSAEQVQTFLGNPEAYTPVHDGCDPVLLSDTGSKVPGLTENCVVFEGKLYMFSSEETLNKFFENVENYR